MMHRTRCARSKVGEAVQRQWVVAHLRSYHSLCISEVPRTLVRSNWNEESSFHARITISTVKRKLACRKSHECHGLVGFTVHGLTKTLKKLAAQENEGFIYQSRPYPIPCATVLSVSVEQHASACFPTRIRSSRSSMQKA